MGYLVAKKWKHKCKDKLFIIISEKCQNITSKRLLSILHGIKLRKHFGNDIRIQIGKHFFFGILKCHFLTFIKNSYFIYFFLYFSAHVLTEDTVCREIRSGKLFSKRLLSKTNSSVPKWAEKFVPGGKIVCIVEESIVDPKRKELITYTRNLGHTKIMVCLTINKSVNVHKLLWNIF